MITIGQRIKTLRVENKTQQKELAKALGFSISALQNFENGVRVPSLEKQIALAKFFGVSIEYLRGESDDRRPSLVLRDARSTYNTENDDYELHAHRDTKTEGMPLDTALSLVTQLERLAKLHDDGKITDEEYSILKGKIIRG